jgi:hypothetical protein
MSSNQSTICAEFKLNKDGNPTFLESPYKQYFIKIFIENPPINTFLVNYEIREFYDDHDDLVREIFGSKSTSGTDKFELSTTSGGDYLIKASIRTKDYVTSMSKMLSEVLQENYRNTTNQTIQSAIEDIIKN